MPQIKKFELPYPMQGKTMIYGIIRRQGAGLFLDYSTGAFVAVPVNPYNPAIEDSVLRGVYAITEARFAWPDGYYFCVFYDKTGATEDPSVDHVLGSTILAVSADAEVSYPAVATGYTYDDIKTDALVGLKGTAKAAYKDPIMNKIVNDAVQIARKIASLRNPEMIQSSMGINLTADLDGPYNISNDFESPVKLLDENQKEVDSSYRGEFNVPQRRRKPDGFWIEGYAPAAIYLNATPDKAYAWTLYYIATRARVTDFTLSVPLPPMFREPLVEFTTKYAAQTQEYTTVEEDEKISLLDTLLSGILRKRRSAMRITVSGVGF